MRYVVSIIIIVALIAVMIFVIPVEEVTLWNRWVYNLKKANDNSNYDKLKEAEDTCRAMISSYEFYRIQYEMYKDSTDEFEINMYANPAKIEANKIASAYNNYILENNFLWKDNIPDDIKTELPYIR